jgi:hypothetical protein
MWKYLGLWIVAGFLLPAAEAREPAIRKPAPDFSLVDTDGKTHRLSQYRDKIVVLEWLNHDCPAVRKHYKSGNMQKLQKTWTEEGVVWFSINSSAPGHQGHYPPDKAAALTRQKGAAPTAVLLDWHGDVGRAYGVRATPQMFVINKEGVLVYKGAVDDRPSSGAEDLAGARNYVEAALKDLAAGKSVRRPATRPYGCPVRYQ